MSNMTVNDLMGLRNAVLNKNAALRNAAANSGSGASATEAGQAFERTIDAAFRKAWDGTSVNGAGKAEGFSRPEDAPQGGFVSIIREQLQNVNGISAHAGKLTEAFERGEETDIAKVMLARQASSVAFEATLQVRNKLLSAYKDIMSMPV